MPAPVIKRGTSELEVASTLDDMEGDTNPKAENLGDKEITVLEQNGIELARGNKQVLVNDGGVRVAHDGDEDEDEHETKTARKKHTSKNFNSTEARFLSLFACTKDCHRKIWDKFFLQMTASVCLINMLQTLN